MHHPSYPRIREAFIRAIKDVSHFPFDDRDAQEEVAEHLLDTVCEQLRIYMSAIERRQILQQLLDTVVFGLRQIQKLQDDPEIEEIMINGLDNVFVRRRFSDATERVPVQFHHRNELRSIIEKLLEGTGRRVDRSSPLVDTRLMDGSRVNIVIEPLSLHGPIITIRKFPEKPITADDLLTYGTMNDQMYQFLKAAVEQKKNIIISGSTAAGKTTTLTGLLQFVNGGASGDRLVVIEQIAELQVPEHITNTVRLETRPENAEGKGAFTIRDLLKNALRMRPDRIIIGESRGGEAFDLLQALNTGHEGSFTTLHANSAADALQRLEAMVLLSGFDQLPLGVIRSWISRSVDFVIQQKRFEDGSRRITEIAGLRTSESLLANDQQIQLDTIASYDTSAGFQIQNEHYQFYFPQQ